MRETMGRPRQVRSLGDHVEVVGVPEDDVTEALEMLDEFRAAQRTASTAVTNSLVDFIVTQRPALSPERTAAAQRLAAHRAELLVGGTFTQGDLALLRGDKDTAAVRAMLRRRRGTGQVIEVKERGRSLLPAFQFTEDGNVRPDVAKINTVLDGALSSWEKWGWWRAPTGLLSGQSPLDVVSDDADRVHTAARRTVQPPAW